MGVDGAANSVECDQSFEEDSPLLTTSDGSRRDQDSDNEEDGHPIDAYLEERRLGADGKDHDRHPSTSLIDAVDRFVHLVEEKKNIAHHTTTSRKDLLAVEQKKNENKKDSQGAIKKSTGLYLPPPLQSLDVTPAGMQPPAGVIVITGEDGDEYDVYKDATKVSAEYRKLSRPVRYFDDDVDGSGGNQAPTCFKCGLVGHMAKECPNPAKPRPCYLCAGYGHGSSHCPHTSCFRCGETGHQARDCSGVSEGTAAICRSCGRVDCKASHTADLLRAEGKCNREYMEEDLKRLGCMSCGGWGHANCMPLAQTAPHVSCYNCGDGGHTGLECRIGPTASVGAERRRLYHQTTHHQHQRSHHHHHQNTRHSHVPMQRLGVNNTWSKNTKSHQSLGPMRRHSAMPSSSSSSFHRTADRRRHTTAGTIDERNRRGTGGGGGISLWKRR
jgi:hypothetical protein